MIFEQKPKVAIVDMGIGNLFSVQQACNFAGLDAVISSNREEIKKADGLILPGVGAYGRAMNNLAQNGLVEVLRKHVSDGKPFMGICLGMQLLMEQSTEFGTHEGLGLVQGTVEAFDEPGIKVPHISWTRIHGKNWESSLLKGVQNRSSMYFVHSYYVKVTKDEDVLCRSQYGKTEFSSGLKKGSVCAFQFHPERSGPVGLQVYKNFALGIALWKSTDGK